MIDAAAVTADASDVLAGEEARLRAEDLIATATSAFDTMLGMPLDVVPEAAAAPPPAQIAGSIGISGCYSCTVLIDTSTRMALAAAVAMLGFEADELSVSDVNDAFGEIVNVVGGGLKCLLPEPSQLGLPTVVRGEGLTTAMPGARLAAAVRLTDGQDELSVAVWRAAQAG